MSWIVYDLLMFAASVVLYLTIRRSSLYKLPTQFSNLAIFLIPVVIFNVAALLQSYRLTLSQLAIIVLAGVFLSYAPSIFSLKSIDVAPNPGYSLLISKNYVLMTTFLAVPLFHQVLTLRGVLAVLLIVLFSSLIIFDGKVGRHKTSDAWLPLALGAFVGWGLLSLTAKYLYGQGVPPIVFLAYIALVATICIVAEMFVKKVSLQPFKQHPWIFITIGLASTAFNFFNFYTIKVAPNVGYVNATNAASIGAVTVFATLLFKDEFSPRKFIGVVGSILALTILFI